MGAGLPHTMPNTYGQDHMPRPGPFGSLPPPPYALGTDGGMYGWMILIRQPSGEKEQEGEPPASSIHPSLRPSTKPNIWFPALEHLASRPSFQNERGGTSYILTVCEPSKWTTPVKCVTIFDRTHLSFRNSNMGSEVYILGDLLRDFAHFRLTSLSMSRVCQTTNHNNYSPRTNDYTKYGI